MIMNKHGIETCYGLLILIVICFAFVLQVYAMSMIINTSEKQDKGKFAEEFQYILASEIIVTFERENDSIERIYTIGDFFVYQYENDNGSDWQFAICKQLLVQIYEIADFYFRDYIAWSIKIKSDNGIIGEISTELTKDIGTYEIFITNMRLQLKSGSSLEIELVIHL